MPKTVLEESNLIFQPELSWLAFSRRRLKNGLLFFVYAALILCGLAGLVSLIVSRGGLVRRSLDGGGLVRRSLDGGGTNLFYLSLLADMFLVYLLQRRRERAGRIDPTKADQQTEVSQFLSARLHRALESAWRSCRRRQIPFIRPIHIFLALIQRPEFTRALRRLNCPPEEILRKTRKLLDQSGPSKPRSAGQAETQIELAAELEEIFVTAYLSCLKESKERVEPLDVLLVMSRRENLVAMIFDEFGIEPEDISRLVQWIVLEQEVKRQRRYFSWRRLLKPKGKLDRAMTASLTPALDRMSSDLTATARQEGFELVIGRREQVERILDSFSAGQTAVILTGPSQVGKKAVLQRLAQLMVAEEVPDFLQDKRLVQLDIGKLVGLEEARARGEEYLKQALFETAQAGNIILIIEHVDRLVDLRAQSGGLAFAEILTSALNEHTFYFIGTSRLQDYADKVESSSLVHVLSKIDVPEPSAETLWKILMVKALMIEGRFHVLFSIDALGAAIRLSGQYLYGKSLLARSIDVLLEAAQLAERRDVIKEEDIARLVAQRSQVPLGQVQKEEKEKLLHLEEVIHERLVDQEEAVRAVAEALRRSRLELQGRTKTAANFLFVGPTGVGKTELAKSLARVYFGSEKSMIRLDMSEYQEQRSLRRLIGMRSDRGITRGHLTEAVKRHPHSLLLLDELEKAHPDILHIFLQLMDDGRLTDVSGETINFTHVILIATSNAGTRFIQDRMRQGAGYEEICQQLQNEVLLRYFKPEFLNRFDKIILFRGLSMEHVAAIARLFLQTIVNQLDERGVTFRVTDEAVRELAAAGYDPLYGARPLRRVIQDRVESPVARLFLEDKLKRRDTLILGEGLRFEIKKAVSL